LTAQSAAWICQQSELTPQWLANWFESLSRDQLRDVAIKAYGQKSTQAVKTLCDVARGQAVRQGFHQRRHGAGARIMKHAIQHIHFVGIGGAGMSGIAEVLLNLDYRISGSDLSNSVVLERLKSLGIETQVGHDAKNISGADAVVTSTAVKDDNPRWSRHIDV
jgi:hypothetical protein